MKRSEMIQKLKDKIYQYESNYGQDPELLAKEILSLVLLYGMLPPINYSYSCGCSMRGICPACTPNEYNMYNTWEKED